MRDLPTAEKTPTPANGARGSDCAESDFFIGRAYSIAKIYNIMYSRPRAACGSGFFCAFLQVFCYIYNFKSVFFAYSTVYAVPPPLCVRCATQTELLSTRCLFFLPYNRCDIFGSIYRLIRQLLDTLVFSAVIFVPKFCLVGAGQNENQPYLRIFVFQSYHGLRRNGIKTESPARAEKTVTVRYKPDNGFFKFVRDFVKFLRRQLPVPGETTGFIFHITNPFNDIMMLIGLVYHIF